MLGRDRLDQLKNLKSTYGKLNFELLFSEGNATPPFKFLVQADAL